MLLLMLNCKDELSKKLINLLITELTGMVGTNMIYDFKLEVIKKD